MVSMENRLLLLNVARKLEALILGKLNHAGFNSTYAVLHLEL